MSDLVTYPLQDGFETTLSQAWTGVAGTVYVNSVPSFTFPSGVTTYIVVDPGKSNMQVAKINAYDGTALTITVSSTSVNKGASVAYTEQSHSVGAKVIISDNYQFRADITTAMNSKLDESGGTVSGTLTVSGASAKIDASGAKLGFEVPQLTTAERTALSDIGQIVYDTDLGLFYQYKSTGWASIDTGTTTPNASTTVAGSVELATQTEFDAGTATGATGASLVATPTLIYKGIGTSTAKTTLVDADAIGIMDSADSNINKKVTLENFRNEVGLGFFGDGSDGDVTITTTITLTEDMYYNNLTITSPGILIPNGYRVFVKGILSGNGKIQRNGNAGTNGSAGSGNTGGAGGAGGTALNQGNLLADLGGGAGGAGANVSGDPVAGTAGTSASPSFTTINGVAGGQGGIVSSTGGAGGVGGTSVRGAYYNTIISVENLLSYLQYPATYPAVSTFYKGPSSSGGGGGGNDGASGGEAGGGGGGGGGNAGVIRAVVKTVNRTGIWEAIGGKGGDGGDGAGPNLGGGNCGGGGGGGGNGGVIILLYGTLTAEGTYTVTAGAIGIGGQGGLTAGDGGSGTIGNVGVTIKIAV